MRVAALGSPATIPQTADVLGAASNCDEFLRLRSDQSLSDEQFAHAVFSMPVFEDKRKLVAIVLSRKWEAGRLDDAMQEAAITVYAHLTATRGMRFSGCTDDALAAWLYVLSLRNTRWALVKIARGERRRRARERSTTRREAHQEIPERKFTKVFDRVLAEIEALPAPLRTVGLDLHYGVAAKDTAKVCGISERRVYEIRTKVLAMIADALDAIR